MRLVTAETMRELDGATIASGVSGVSGELLMERAGSGAVGHILEFAATLHEAHARRFVLLAGKGNNGGDAYVCARCLHELGAETVLYSPFGVEELSGEAALNAGRMPELSRCHFNTVPAAGVFREGDIIIDGLLGTGFSGAPRGPVKEWIEAVNASGMPVVSLDIPSGLDGGSGRVSGVAIRADLTVCIGLPKLGICLGAGPEHCGLLRCVDIGIKDDDAAEGPRMPFFGDIRPRLGRVPTLSHKNRRGRLLVLGGSEQYGGAPFLAACAAVRTGAGYVKMLMPGSAGGRIPVPPSLVLCPLPDGGTGSFGEVSLSGLDGLLNAGSDALVTGPGLGRGRGLVPFLSHVCGLSLPMVFDADALNLIAEIPEIYMGKDTNVLTPHPGEMKRLLSGFDLEDHLNSDRMTQAAVLAERLDSTVVLKGPRTVICSPDGRMSINSTGSPALAKAGTGDCLAGMIGAFLSQGMEAFEAAEAAVFIHGLAGELSACGQRGLTAESLVEGIPLAMRRISPFA